MDATRWKLTKRSGCYRRKIRKAYERIQKINEHSNGTDVDCFRNCMQSYTNNQSSSMNSGDGSVGNTILSTNHIPVIDVRDCTQTNNDSNFMNVDEGSIYTSCIQNPDANSDDDDGQILYAKLEKEIDLRTEIHNWALKHNVTHVALKDLLQILNKTTPNLPTDPRTLLGTPRAITTTLVESGEYWHNGLKKCIVKILDSKATDIPQGISITINIDGLPIHNSSKQQFWPILCSIFERPELQPTVCGIYVGESKPKDLKAYLSPFVDELDDLLQNGVEIQNKIVQVNLRCFVCDSPARAMIKGICNYNGKHGCPKCTIVGEYSHISHTVIFPIIDCPLRNDKDFREKKYGDHHKIDSPLLKLPINMIEDIPVADSLHLIDLGIMKRLLIGWRDGNFGKKNTKWRASDIQTVNIFLRSCKTPTEIHRAVRGLDNLTHWKGSEYRTFFYYLSVIILRKVLMQDALQHFLTLFCAITICSTDKHFRYLSLADELLKYYVTHYKDFYGVDYMTSNVHNLIHVVDEVRRFGTLQTFNAYKFENKLYTIKNLLRQGNKPLVQVAKRLCEYENVEQEQNDVPHEDYPFVKKRFKSQNLVLHFKDFVLSTKSEDKYFLTLKKEIMEVKCIKLAENKINIHCNKFDHLQNVFDLPICSSYLNIFKSKDDTYYRTECMCLPTDVECKLVVTSLDSELYFIPLLHTLKPTM